MKVVAVADRYTGDSKGFGFVEMSSLEEAAFCHTDPHKKVFQVQDAFFELSVTDKKPTTNCRKMLYLIVAIFKRIKA